MASLVGIDIGTQGVKAALYTADGLCLAEAFRPSRPLRPEPGTVEEDPEFQYTSALEVVAECLAKAGEPGRDVAALGIAGQMAGVLGIDRAGRAVTPYDSWLDTRCSAQIVEMSREAGDEILGKTGNAPSFNHGPKILWWKQTRPEAYARIHAFVQPGGYVAMRLCGLDGAEAFIDATYLHFSGYADTRRRAWDADLCARFGIDPGKLPRIVAPHEVVGRISSEAARASGLPEGLPVVAGCGDTAASFLSCGATREGICVDVAGTASVFAATTSEFIADPSRTLGCGPSVVPGLWHPYAYVNGGGQNLEWFRGTILKGRLSFEELNRLPEVADADPLRDASLPFFVPHLGGRVSPNWPALRGGWVGLGWDASEGTLFRSMLEGVALEYGLYRRALRALLPGFEIGEIRITGGGEKSAPWNRIKADRLRADVVGIARAGGAPVGAALLAGHGVGLFPALATAADCWTVLGARTRPAADPRIAALGEARIGRYAALLDALHGWSAAS
ncbi:xylulokinase [Verrucomicrobium sp. GAS474]|uniref:FGGY-family carbohydrate kinase n=1 Tax=Verrucomicrobium sp. GAS474 TaxID=1882831 RepID=UPI00087A4841|nr:FGGY family carbohydrate kinase [Verrucomicrobium sp. GAS474]SDT98699.1 xylulokinase [Verrucomicrobium sp. GAS474]